MRYFITFGAGLVIGIVASSITIGINHDDVKDERQHWKRTTEQYETSIEFLRQYIYELETRLKLLEGK